MAIFIVSPAFVLAASPPRPCVTVTVQRIHEQTVNVMWRACT